MPRGFVILSAAKDLPDWLGRSFVALRMTTFIFTVAMD
jgi:hypothetical protein